MSDVVVLAFRPAVALEKRRIRCEGDSETQNRAGHRVVRDREDARTRGTSAAL